MLAERVVPAAGSLSARTTLSLACGAAARALMPPQGRCCVLRASAASVEPATASPRHARLPESYGYSASLH